MCSIRRDQIFEEEGRRRLDGYLGKVLVKKCDLSFLTKNGCFLGVYLYIYFILFILNKIIVVLTN